MSRIKSRLQRLEAKSSTLPTIDAVIHVIFGRGEIGSEKTGAALALFCGLPRLPNLRKIHAEPKEDFDRRVDVIVERIKALKALPEADQEAEKGRLEAEIIAANDHAKAVNERDTKEVV